MWKRLLIGVIVGVLAVTPVVRSQTFPVPIAQAIALLITGVTVFEIVGVEADGYINFDTGRSATGYGFRDNGGVMQVKNSGEDWTNFTTSGGAPSSATYIVQTPNAGLSAEQALSALGSALLVNTTGTGVLSAYAGSSCTSQVVTALSALGVVTCSNINFSTLNFTGQLPVLNGGSGASTLTGILQGNGTSAFTALTSSTAGQVLRVTGANTFGFGAVDLDDTDAVTGTLAVANGGTNLASGTSGGVLGYTASGTLASSVALTANNLVIGGGAGATPTPLGSLGTTSQVLIGNAAGAPTWGAVNIGTMTTGTLGPTVGGTGLTAYTTGDLIHATATNTLAALSSVSANSFLRSAGVGTANVWSTTKWTNSATTGDVLYASGSNQYANLAVGGTAGMFIRSTGTLPAWSTLVLPNAATVGDIPIATSSNTLTMLTAVATGRLLVSTGVATAPAWSTDPTANSFTVSTSFNGPGTVASTGEVRLANADGAYFRNAGDSADVLLIGSTSADHIGIGELFLSSHVPTISSGFGTTPSIAGFASAFKVTVGSGGDTSGVVLFNTTWPTAPVCTANNQTTAQLVRANPTTTQVTLAGTMTAADIVSVICIAY